MSDWRDEAACVGVDPEAFFPIGTTGPAVEQIEQAKAVCARCPVLGRCLAFAVEMGLTDGVWGGLSEEERKAMKRRAARTRQRAAAAPAPVEDVVIGGPVTAAVLEGVL